MSQGPWPPLWATLFLPKPCLLSGAVRWLERVTPDDRPPHLAWFNIAVNIAVNVAVNVAVLLCDLIASPISGVLGLFGTMLLAIGLRFVAGLVIIRWG